ncbi:MAG: carbohydrate porin [Chromatiaceae bacterium]|nr:carbohydrate porin [Chromatiaceae bacterium]
MSFSIALPARAFDMNDQLSIGGILAATGQCQSVSALLPSASYGAPFSENRESSGGGVAMGNPVSGNDDSMDAFGNECRDALPFQLEVSYHPNDYNEFFFKLGFGVGNGLNEVSPWILAPWAADLEDDVQDINGRGRDYLLAAWYKHTRVFQAGSTLGATIGIIDSTDYIDGNAYANDEYTQFMNEAFVNAGNYNLPSYDAGAALELTVGEWTFSGLGMNIGENDDGDNYNFWGVEVGYHPQTTLSAGNYRLILAGTSSEFLNPAGDENESRLGYGLSFDQEFGEIVGGFLRFTWQEDDAAVDYKSMYSGGLNVSGKAWNRDEDNIGVGYARLKGGNGDVEKSQVFEVYYRAALNDFAAVTADVQYMDDDLIDLDPREEDPDGWIFGLRLTTEF